MRLPKSNIFLLSIVLAINSYFAFGQASLLFVNDSTKSCSFDTYKLDQLVKNDSLYKATILLNEAINFSKNTT